LEKSVTDQTFDPAIQTRPHGPLTPNFQKRILEAKQKHRLTYWDIAERAGFSGSFLGNITRYDVNVGTPTANKLAAVIEKLEVAPEGSAVASSTPASGIDTPSATRELVVPEDRALGNLEVVTRFAAAQFGVDVSEIEVRISIRPQSLAA
jgi:transcriptional regulator with XRE-family HTH domain